MKNIFFKNIAIAGDIQGISLLLKQLPKQFIGGIVAASISPEIINYMEFMSHSLKVPLIIQLPKKSKNYNYFVEDFKSQNFDLLICSGHAMIFEKEILENVKYKAINIHNSLLPKYKSQNAIQHAIMNNETETGVTFYLMNENVFEGEIIYQQKTTISNEDTNITVLKKINNLKVDILKKNLTTILDNKFVSKKQVNSNEKKMKKISEEDLKIDLHKMFDIEIYNLIRANTELQISPHIFFNEEKIIFNQFLTLEQIKIEMIKYISL